MVAIELWIGKAQRFAQEKANAAFAKWLETDAGKKWLTTHERKRKSPYYCGYQMPDWQGPFVAAMGRGDEEYCKSVMMHEHLHAN